jgi:hypothetical protein
MARKAVMSTPFSLGRILISFRLQALTEREMDDPRQTIKNQNST